MKKYVIHSGEFLSRRSALYRVDLWRLQSTAPEIVGELRFEVDDPVVIEWGEASTSEAVEASTLTLRVESPTDRAYVDLYTYSPGTVGVDVYRENRPYWSGALDPEFYEEPYEREAHYPVSLTFSDFGTLDRIDFGLTASSFGVVSVWEIIKLSLQRAGLDGLSIDTSGISTRSLPARFAASRPLNEAPLLDLRKVLVQRANFFDENGEAETLREVLERVLLPLGLRIRQRAGRVWVYDLHGQATALNTVEVWWSSDRQTLGVAPVASEVTLTFSPYGNAELISEEIEFKGHADARVFLEYPSLDSDAPGSRYPELSPYWRYYHPLIIDMTAEEDEKAYWQEVARYADDGRLNAPIEYAIFLTDSGTGVEELHPKAKYFRRLNAAKGGKGADGVAWRVGSSLWFPETGRATHPPLDNPIGVSNEVVFRTKRVYLPRNTNADALLRLRQEVILSATPTLGVDWSSWYERGKNDKFAPLREAFDIPHKFKVWTGWGFIPIGITLYNDVGVATYHYTNRETTESFSLLSPGHYSGRWERWAGQWGDAWLAYYDAKDPRENAGFRDEWTANRPNLGRPDHARRTNLSFADDKAHLFDFAKQLGDGELIEMPPEAGWLEITVYAGVCCFDYGEGVDFSFDPLKKPLWESNDLYNKVRWLLYKSPKLDVVQSYGANEPVEIDDIEHRATLLSGAKEGISVDTYVGTMRQPQASARGLFLDPARSPYLRLARGDFRGSPETLLINTLYSQHAARHTTLSGEAGLLSDGLPVYTDAHQGSKHFRAAEERQNLFTDTADLVLIEVSPDQFAPIDGQE